MNTAQDLYAILGVSPSATTEDIRSAYRSAARRLHPDVNSNPGAGTQFRDIVNAHEILSDPVQRLEYDNKRKQAGAEKQYFTLRVTPSKRVLPILEEAQVLYMLVELLPERSQSLQQLDSPLNLTLVIDHSTSMKGTRMERVRAAAYQIIDQLNENDILSVVTFSDRADVLVKAAPVAEKPIIKAMLATMHANGGTEIFQGLEAGYHENQRNMSRKFVNHIILLTDGRTYGDEQQCLELADKAAKEGVGISAIGIGEEWNDSFLDEIASRTGGVSEYIQSPNAVVRFLNDKVRALGRAFAERITISLAPDPDIKIESAFRLMPNPQPVSIEHDPIPVGQLQAGGTTSILFQLQIPGEQRPGFRNLIRVDVTGDIMRDQKHDYKVIADTTIELSQQPPQEEPPLLILDALGKLTLYRMQERANDSLARGEVHEATRQLENLATRLLAAGQNNLANAAMAEARRVSSTNMLSEEGHKALKYGTRMLLAAPETPVESSSSQ